MNSDEKQIKPSANIPVKNVKIHQPAEAATRNFSPSDAIYVRKITGFFTRVRRYMNIFFMVAFAALPWLQYEGHQALLFDISEQRFTIWSLTLWPQDLTLLAWIFIVGAFLLFFVTTFLGRVWCGYLCPQTVWTFIFIWFEEKIEGTANQRKKLDSLPMSFNKFWRKALKHISWLLVSLLTALTFAGFFTPSTRPVYSTFFTFNASIGGGITVFYFLPFVPMVMPVGCEKSCVCICALIRVSNQQCLIKIRLLFHMILRVVKVVAQVDVNKTRKNLA